MRELRGVRYVNDSKATNTAAARRGVAAYDEPLRLILGGSLKGEDFGPFARDLPANVRSIYLIGEAADELAAALDAAGRPYARDGDLAHALAHAAAQTPSPATSSCSRRPAPATTSSTTSSSAARRSARSSRRLS